MDFILVGFGGICGSLTRFIVGKEIIKRKKGKFPISTFIINITGAISLGILSHLEAQRYIYLIFAEGFLGAYTTFSTFMYEGFSLFQQNDKLNMIVYILSSLVLGIFGFYTGYVIFNI